MFVVVVVVSAKSHRRSLCQHRPWGGGAQVCVFEVTVRAELTFVMLMDDTPQLRK